MRLCLVARQSTVRLMFIERSARPYCPSSRCSVQFYWNEVERKRRRSQEGLRDQFTELGDDLPGCGSEPCHGPAAAASIARGSSAEAARQGTVLRTIGMLAVDTIGACCRRRTFGRRRVVRSVAESLNKGGEWEALTTGNSLGLTYYSEMTGLDAM